MAVLIEGMEMPKSCYSCPLRKRNGIDIVCPVVQEKFSVADVNVLFYRLNSCPLVPVPPHGDLIDASEKIRVKMYDVEHEDFHTVEMTIDDLLSQSWVKAYAFPIIPASESKERPAFLPTYELTPRKTNADRIRRMSDKELAELLVSTDGEFPPNCEDVPVRKLEAYWLDWLRQEAGNG